MNDHADLLPETARQVRHYEGRMQRAQEAYDEAVRVLKAVEVELEAAKRELVAAQHVANAAWKDRIADMNVTGLTQKQLAWLAELVNEVAISAGAFQDAARKVGWDVSDDTLRQQLSRLTKRGILERLSRGDYRVSREAKAAIAQALINPPPATGEPTEPSDRNKPRDQVGESISDDAEPEVEPERDFEAAEADVDINVPDAPERQPSSDQHHRPRELWEEEDDDPPF